MSNFQWVQWVQQSRKGENCGLSRGGTTELAMMMEVREESERPVRRGEESTQKGGKGRAERSQMSGEERPRLASRSACSFMGAAEWALTHLKSKVGRQEGRR